MKLFKKFPKLNFPFHKKLFVSLSTLFLVFLLSVFIFQYQREKNFREKELNSFLSNYNINLYHSLKGDQMLPGKLDSVIKTYDYPDLRISVIEPNGKVIFDSEIHDVNKLEKHADRPEIQTAKKNGIGYSIRYSTSMKTEYFYTAQQFDSLIIRSALPYDTTTAFLKTDSQFIYFLISLSLFVILTLLYFSYRLGVNISRLKEFATRAERNEKIDYNISFPDNDIGDISRNIVQIYKKLKNTKEALYIERDKLFQHLQISKEGLAIFSNQRKCIFANNLFKQYADLIADIQLDKVDQILFVNEFQFITAFIEQQIDQDQQQKKKFRDFVSSSHTIYKNGKTFQVNCIIFQDNTFEISISNITQKEEENRLKRQLTQNISHELKTPVSSIKGYLETILETDNIPEDKLRFFLERCFVQATRLGDLLADISVLTRLDEAGSLFDLQPININTLVTDIYKDSMQALEQKGDTFSIQIPENCEIQGNHSLLYSIFRNLLDNAIAYAGENIQIQIQCYREDKQFYYFTFSDSGTGVNEEHLNRIFERFYRVDKGRSRKLGGTGLGLAIVKNAVLFHHGEISARKHNSGGLEILFSLMKTKPSAEV
ncbi:MAG: sensor histidine kinase [Bacteroidales bacterium]